MLRDWARRQGRFWRYPRNEWLPRFRWLPYLGADEYGRRTIVLPIPFSGYVVIAFRVCRCEWCREGRRQTWEFEQEEKDDDE